jgi:ATP-dependent protease ClpP protease subunit
VKLCWCNITWCYKTSSISSRITFIVKIDSVGGYVDVVMIYIIILKNLDVPVTTYTTKAYSQASVIFMAGETRVQKVQLMH